MASLGNLDTTDEWEFKPTHIVLDGDTAKCEDQFCTVGATNTLNVKTTLTIPGKIKTTSDPTGGPTPEITAEQAVLFEEAWS